LKATKQGLEYFDEIWPSAQVGTGQCALS